MNQKFKNYVDSLEPAFRKLAEMHPVMVPTLPGDIPISGVYLFSEGTKNLFVGRSNRLRTRLQEHCRPSSNHNTAHFAFRLAREATGLIDASYTPEKSRAALERTPGFREVFAKSKERVRMMDVRFVEVADPLLQALLVIYVAVALQTQFNEFQTH